MIGSCSWDCDEIITPELAQSIQDVMNRPMDERDGYYLDRRGDFYGTAAA